MVGRLTLLAVIFGEEWLVRHGTTQKTVIHCVGCRATINGNMKNKVSTEILKSDNLGKQDIGSLKRGDEVLYSAQKQSQGGNLSCKECGIRLKTKHPRKNRTGFCNKCVQKHAEPEKNKLTKQCKTCKRDFPAKRNTKLFCTTKCNVKFHGLRFQKPELFKRQHPLLITRGVKPRRGTIGTCKLCGKERYLFPRETHQKNIFCSKEHLIKYIKKNSFNFPCSICRSAIFTQPAQLKYRARSTCSKECRSILSRKRAEERRVGYTKHQLDRIARYSPEAERWRQAIFERDNFTCRACLRRGGYLEADHIKPWAYFPELRYTLSNGRTLCRPCHDKTKVGAKKMREMWGKKNTDTEYFKSCEVYTTHQRNGLWSR